MGGPAGMALADQAVIVDADLDDVDEQPLPVLGPRAVAAGQEDGIGEALGVGLGVVGHAVLGHVEGEEARVAPGPLDELGELDGVRGVGGPVEVRQQVAFEVAGQVDLGVVAAIARAEGVGRQRAGDAGEHGDDLDGAVVAHAAHGAGMIGIGDLLPLAEADAGGQAVAGLHGDGQPGAVLGGVVVHDAGVPGHLLPGGGVEHGAVAAALVHGDFLAAVEFVVGDLLAIARGGVDLDDGDGADDVEVAIDELPDAGGLLEGPGDAVLADALFERQGVELGRGRGVVLGIDNHRAAGRGALVGRRGRTRGQRRQGQDYELRSQKSHGLTDSISVNSKT